MKVEVRQKHPGWTEKLKARLKAAAGLSAAVGFPSGEGGVSAPHYPTGQSAAVRKRKNKEGAPPGGGTGRHLVGSGPSVLEVAVWNNYGTGSIPRRAFMELAADRMREEWRAMARQAAGRLNAGELDAKTLLAAGGLMGEAMVRRAIDDGEWAPNAPATQILKGGNDPLRDSHDMKKYVTHVIRERL